MNQACPGTHNGPARALGSNPRSWLLTPQPQSRLRKKAKAQQLAQQLEGMKAENAALAEENEAMRRVRTDC